MTMAAVAAGIGAVGGIAAASMSGGGGGSESSSVPFFAAIPGMVRNANKAAELEGQYFAEPFNPQQLAAINNLYGQSDYMRQLVPGLLQQLQGQQVGFDRNNPTARPQAWNWGLLANAPASAGGAQQPAPMAGLLAAPTIGESAGSALGLLQSGVRNTAPGVGAQDHRPVSEQPVAAAAPAQQPQNPQSQFVQTTIAPHMVKWDDPWSMGAQGANTVQGGYGSFQYGQPGADMSNPQWETDARMYFALGGNDPDGRYTQYMSADRRKAMEDAVRMEQLNRQG